VKVKVFLKSANHDRFKQTLISFAEGVARSGDVVTLSEADHYEECDCAIIFGSWKDRNSSWHKVKRDVVSKAKNFIVLETPILGRKKVDEIMTDTWYRIGLNGFLNNTGNFNNKNRPGDRWRKIQKELGVEVLPWTDNKDGPIILALQLPGDASLSGLDINKWAYNRVISIRNISKNPIIVRTPQLQRQFDLPKIIGNVGDISVQQGTKENLIPTLRDAYCSVSYSSGLGVDSVLAGCPTVAWSPANFAYDISSKFISNINSVHKPDRSNWLHDLSYCQWNVEEISWGLPWEHLKPLL